MKVCLVLSMVFLLVACGKEGEPNSGMHGPVEICVDNATKYGGMAYDKAKEYCSTYWKQ